MRTDNSTIGNPMKRNNVARTLLLAAVCLLAFYSCIDNDYDLNKIDYVLGNEVDITIPTSSTGSIMLRGLLDLKEDGIVQIIKDPTDEQDSIFALMQSGKANIAPICIGAITIKKPRISDFTTQLDLWQELTRSSARKTKIRYDYTIRGENKTFTYDIPSWDYSYPIDPEKAKTNFTDAEATGISADVVKIESISCEEVTVTIKLSMTGVPDWFTCVRLDDFWVGLPEDIQVSKCVFDGEEISKNNIKKGTIQLTKGKDSKKRSIRDLSLSVSFNKATEGKNFRFDALAHTAHFGGALQVGGSVRLRTDDIDEEKLNRYLKTITTQMEEFMKSDDKDLKTLAGVVPRCIQLKIATNFNKDIVINGVTGDFLHYVGEIDPLKLSDLPEFLCDPNVVLDVNNPVIYLDASTDLPVAATTSITLSSDTDPEKHTTESIFLTGWRESNLFYLSDHKELKYHWSKKYEYKEVKNMGNLIRKLPKQIDISIDTLIIRTEDFFQLGKEYPIDINYNIFIPFSFGPDFKIVYQGSERGWDLPEAVRKLNAQSVVATARVTNMLPEDVTFTLVPIDRSGREIKELESNSVHVNALAKRKEIRVTIKAKNGHSINDILTGNNGANQLDGILYKAVIENPQNADALPATARIKISDISVKIQGIVSYDAN